LIASVEKPFHRLDTETWLHGRPEEDVYKLLIDTYRLRMDDDYKFDGEADTDSIYGGALDGRQGFQCFLRTAHRKRHLLPPWWSQEKAAECVGVGMKKGKWSDLACTIEKSDIIEHYGSPMMPMQLRMFGEQIYGRGPGGQSGASMLKLQKMAENGGDGLHMSHLDLRSAFART
jgi:splicing suppressor protein 51